MYTNKPLRSIVKAATLDGQIKAGGKHVHDPIATLSQFTTLTLETETPTRLMLDGDLVGFTPLTITVRPAVLPIYTPEDPAPS